MCSSSSTQSVDIKDVSPQEKELLNLMMGTLFPGYLEQAGYDVKTKPVNYQDTPEYKSFQDRRQRMIDQRSSYEQQLNSLPSGGQNNASTRQDLMSQIAGLNNRLDSLDKEEQKFSSSFIPYNTYETRKLLAPELEAKRSELIAQYGELSDQELMNLSSDYKDMYQSYQQAEIDNDKTMRDITKLYMEKTQKYLNGDFSITEEQKAQIQENLAPIREAVTKMFDDTLAEVEKTDANLMELTKSTFDEFESRVKQTGMNMNDALDVVGSQIKATGASMEEALKTTVDVNRTLNKMGIEDFTGQVTKQIASSAASIGRSPDDPEYVNEMKQLVARKVNEGSLNLASLEANGLLAIKERTGAGLEGVAQQKVGVAERTGSALESSTLQRGQQLTSIAAQTGAKREDIARSRGAANLNIAETAANQEWNIGAGMVPGQIGVGQSVSQYEQAILQQRIQNASQAAYSGMPYAGYYQQERFAEPTTTVSQNSGIGGLISAGTGIAGAATGIYGAVQGASYMNKMSDYYQWLGGQTYGAY